MIGVLLQMAVLVACGVAWRIARPQGLDAELTRRALTGLVYYLLLPALVLRVLWLAPLGLDTARIAFSAAGGVLAAMLATWLVCRSCKLAPAVTGASILAASFPNATYLGLPVLEASLGPWARSVAIQYDLFACTPLLLTLGVLVAQIHGERAGRRPALRTLITGLLRIPPLWAALLAVVFNRLDVPLTDWLTSLLDLLAAGVVPLMLISLGLSLRWDTWRSGNIRSLVPILGIQLLLMPLLVWGLADGVGLRGETLIGVVLEGAMPSMVLGIVITDRYGLDTGLYATAVSASTVLSLATLPVWFALLGR